MINKFIFLGLLFGLSACDAGDKNAHKQADLVVLDATIYTMNKSAPNATSMAIVGGKIIAIGSDVDMEAYVGEKTQKLELNGAVVLPGFTDAHVHLLEGEGLLGLMLNEDISLAAMQTRISNYVESHPELEVIYGTGWELPVFENGNPTKEMLDKIVPNKPVVLIAADGHNAWVNSLALKMAKVDATTPDPENGFIERDAGGNPTGTLRESAQNLVTPLVPIPTLKDTQKYLARGVQYQLHHGMTASIMALSSEGVGEEAFLVAAEDGKFPQRVRLSFLPNMEPITLENIPAIMDNLKMRREKFREKNSKRIAGESVKIFVDGVMENYSAAMVTPYVNVDLGAFPLGKMNMSDEALMTFIKDLDANGFNIHTHSLGDRAVNRTLDAFDGAIKANTAWDRRHHIAHLQYVLPDDIARFATLNVAANIQSLWHFKDEYITELTEPFLSPANISIPYPAESFERAGAKVVWGSDWSVSSSNPFLSMEVAVLRKDPNNANDQTWNPDEVMSVEEMLEALTINGAWVMGQEKERGSLSVGMLADFIVIDADPFNIAPENLSEVRVLKTFIEGENVYNLDDIGVGQTE